ncbi:MAG: hypothetical protein RAK22_01975, partial [Nanoarchaeota archaeon]|nr:hypothetical protein [Nanoarchaeota archaeon]
KEKYEKLRNSEVIEDLNKLYVKGIPYVKEDEIATSYQGSEPAFFRIKNEIKSAKDEIVIVSTQSALMHTLRELERALKEAKSSGVNVKIHAPLQELKQELMDEISKLGKFTNLDLELGRFIIIDNNTVFLFTQNDKEIHPSNEIVIHLRGKYIADRFKQMVSAHSKQ